MNFAQLPANHVEPTKQPGCVAIYAIVAGSDVGYVGQSKAPSVRFQQHRCDRSTPIGPWVRRTDARIVILDWVQPADANTREVVWIRAMRRSGQTFNRIPMVRADGDCRRMTFRFPKSLARSLAIAAAQRGITKAAMVEELLGAALKGVR